MVKLLLLQNIEMVCRPVFERRGKQIRLVLEVSSVRPILNPSCGLTRLI